MLKPRGQSSAPFEVLVAVVIMGFVLYMALQAYQYLGKEQCKAQIKDQASSFKSSLQAAIEGQSNLLKFFPPKCFKGENVMKLEVRSQKAICRAECGKEMDQCLLFIYRSADWDWELCLDQAPTFTNFLDSAQCPDPEPAHPDKFEVVDFKNPRDGTKPDIIPRGIYSLQDKTGSQGGIPQICAYHQR